MSPAPPPFQSFLDEHRAAVYAFLLATAGPDEADDCFQETFLAALRAYPRLREVRNLRGWVLTIAHRKALDAHRARRRRPVAGPDAPERTDRPAGSGDPSLNGLGEAWQAVAELPPKQRAALAYRYVCGLSHREIGAALGCSEAAARRSVHEGLERLRAGWAP
ncbi:MAG TPA: sigma-70 family RNA polymerase sigma factor [Thermoleophilaceae bacterium]|nr:sigma-70 family RNA polymerase sigma factor [Thermoleophilaceae bacterium]